jgi:5-methylcytosine-specific restriction endonuclease McrA
MEFRVCTKCGKELPAALEYFHKKKTGKYGLRADCKECCSKRHELYREKHKEGLKEYQKSYRDTHKEEKKQYHKKYWPKYYQANKSSITKKHIEYNRKYIKTKYGRELDRAKKYRRKALDFLNGGSYNPEQWEECISYFDNRCAYSGEILTIENISLDHIIPLSKNGTSYIWNICPSVSYANFSKGDKELELWYRQQTYFSEERLKKIYEWIEYAKFMY